MKKILCLSLTMILIASTITVIAQVSKSNNDYLSISDYNSAYKQSQDDNLLSLDQYNQEYAK